MVAVRRPPLLGRDPAQANYNRAVADYRACVAHNLGNAAACEDEKGIVRDTEEAQPISGQ